MCSPKTMLKIGIAIAVPLTIGFFVFPQFRSTIVGLAPFAIFAICPLSMIFCMKGMMKDKNGQTCESCDTKGREKTVEQGKYTAH